MRSIAGSTVLAFFALTLGYGQVTHAQYERILIPTVAHEPIPGGFGSQWVTEIAGRNLGQTDVRLFFPICPPILCVYDTVRPGEAVGHDALPSLNSPHGTVLTTDRGSADDLAMTVRARDLSRGHLTWGTEIPVAWESQVTDTPITLLDVPNAERFRLTLRMYDFERSENRFVVTVFGLEGDIPLAEIRVPTSPLVDAQGGDQGLYFSVVNDLPLPSNAPERLRLTIGTELSGKFWAFASVTNNDTQHITVISPRRPQSD